MSRPIEGELNPGNPATQMSRDQWHKIVAILMSEFGIKDFEITSSMLDKFQSNQVAVIFDTRQKRLVIRLRPMEEAVQIAREHAEEK